MLETNSFKGQKLDVQTAKKWFEEQQNYGNSATQSGDTTRYDPQWEQTIQTYYGTGSLEVPVKLGVKDITTSLNDGRNSLGTTRLYVFNDPFMNSLNGFIIKFLPSTEFRGQIQNVNYSNFAILSFDGLVVFEDFNQNSLGGFKCKQGRPLSKLVVQNPRNLGVRGGGLTCTEYTNNFCGRAGVQDPATGVIYYGPLQCHSRITTLCTSDPDNPNGNSSGDITSNLGGLGGGGWGGGPGNAAGTTQGPGPGIQCSSFKFTSGAGIQQAVTRNATIQYLLMNNVERWRIGPVTTTLPSNNTIPMKTAAIAFTLAIKMTTDNFRNDVSTTEEQVRAYFILHYSALLGAFGGFATLGENTVVAGVEPTSAVMYSVFDPRWLWPDCEP